MRFLTLRAFLMLILFHVYLVRNRYAAIHTRVARTTIRSTPRPLAAAGDVCRAVDLACIWYPTEVLCLQRSAATACLLKACGVAAQLVVGARLMPFKAHAWVEVDGRVVNDKSYTAEMYAVLDRY